MSQDEIRYDKLIESALRDVVRATIKRVAKDGLPGEHHFYITFQTNYPGVGMPDYLREDYPGEMTIVLQYEFYGLEVKNDYFVVKLSFDDIQEKLEIPFDAITTFTDPSVNFALQFQPIGEQEADNMGIEMEEIANEVFERSVSKMNGPHEAEVVMLDAFRKKKKK